MSANAQVINEGFWVMEKSSNGPMNPRFYIYGTNKYDKDLGEIKIYMVNYNLVCHIQMEHTTRLPLTARIANQKLQNLCYSERGIGLGLPRPLSY